MKKRILIPALIFLIALVIFPFIIVLSISGENDDGDNNIFFEDTGFLLGTIIKIKIYGNEDPSLMDEIFDEIERLESLFSVNIEGSQISAVNDAAGIEPVKVDPEVMEAALKGLEYSSLSGGLFDITVGPLVDLWGIGSEDAKVPEPEEIAPLVENIDYTRLQADEKEGTLYLSSTDMSVDLGGIAKGYIADKIGELLKDSGRGSGIINLGGNILAVGSKPDGTSFRIGVQNPHSDRGAYIGVLSVTDKSVVSSGAYERYLEEDGVRYHHILNPFTGYPVETDIDQVTVVSEKSVDGDGLSTTVFTLGLEKGMELVESLPDVEAVFVNRENEVFISRGLTEYFGITDPDFVLKQ